MKTNIFALYQQEVGQRGVQDCMNCNLHCEQSGGLMPCGVSKPPSVEGYLMKMPFADVSRSLELMSRQVHVRVIEMAASIAKNTVSQEDAITRQFLIRTDLALEMLINRGLITKEFAESLYHHFTDVIQEIGDDFMTIAFSGVVQKYVTDCARVWRMHLCDDEIGICPGGEYFAFTNSLMAFLRQQPGISCAEITGALQLYYPEMDMSKKKLIFLYVLVVVAGKGISKKKSKMRKNQLLLLDADGKSLFHKLVEWLIAKK